MACLGVSECCLGVSGWCLEVYGWCVSVPGDVSIPKSLATNYIRSEVSFSPNAQRRKNSFVWGCLEVSGWCPQVSRWCVRVSEDVSIPNPLAKHYIRSIYSDVAFSSSAL